jgi:predicted dehydrogenase
MAAVGAVFDTKLRPVLQTIAASSAESAERYRASYGYERAARDWHDLVHDPKVEACRDRLTPRYARSHRA